MFGRMPVRLLRCAAEQHVPFERHLGCITCPY
jgi:hypothetical protein